MYKNFFQVIKTRLDFLLLFPSFKSKIIVLKIIVEFTLLPSRIWIFFCIFLPLIIILNFLNLMGKSLPKVAFACLSLFSFIYWRFILIDKKTYLVSKSGNVETPNECTKTYLNYIFFFQNISSARFYSLAIH